MKSTLYSQCTKSDGTNDLGCTSLHSLDVTQYTLVGIDATSTSNKCYLSHHNFFSITAHPLLLCALAMTSPSIFWRESSPTNHSPTSPSSPNLHAFLYQELTQVKLWGQHQVWSVRRHCIRICRGSRHCDLGIKRQSTKLMQSPASLAEHINQWTRLPSWGSTEP